MARNFTPEEAVERYLEERKHDLSDSTLYNYKSNLGLFTDWCSYQSHIQHIGDLDQFDVSDFKMYKRDDVADTTLYNAVMALRTFLKWCESKGLVENLSENIMLPDRGRASRVEKLDPEAADALLEYMEKYEYATYQHVTVALMWDAGLRIGAVRALDVEDYHSAEAYVELHHRPGPGEKDGLNKDRGTPLKNKRTSERHVAISESLADLLDDWIELKRPDVTDEHGREPLITTTNGRIATSTISNYAYKYTQPCRYNRRCPLDRNPETCESTEHSKVSSCPESVSPHPFRLGSITEWLRSDVPSRVVSDRADVSERVIEKHYDERTDQEKMEQRRGYLENV